MKLIFEISDIDYGTMVETLLPVVREKITENDNIKASILEKIAGMPPSMAGKMIHMLPQDVKDEIAVMLITKNKDKIMTSLMEYAEKKGVLFKIDNLEVQ